MKVDLANMKSSSSSSSTKSLRLIPMKTTTINHGQTRKRVVDTVHSTRQPILPDTKVRLNSSRLRNFDSCSLPLAIEEIRMRNPADLTGLCGGRHHSLLLLGDFRVETQGTHPSLNVKEVVASKLLMETCMSFGSVA